MEKLKTMRAFGADVELISSPEGITPTLIPRMRARAAEIAAETGAYQTDQFNNTDMVDGYLALGRELLRPARRPRSTRSASTSGPQAASSAPPARCASGCRRSGAWPSSRRSRAVLSAARPARTGSRVAASASCRRSSIPDDFDEVIAISTADAFAMARRAAREDGVWSGPSTGANIAAALEVAGGSARAAGWSTIQVDSGLKYLAGELYS